MNLQMNRCGGWATVIAFKACEQNEVRDAAQYLAIAGGLRGMQIVDDGIEVAWCMAPDYEWELPGIENIQ